MYPINWNKVAEQRIGPRIQLEWRWCPECEQKTLQIVSRGTDQEASDLASEGAWRRQQCTACLQLIVYPVMTIPDVWINECEQLGKEIVQLWIA